MLIQACSIDTNDMEAERRREQWVVAHEGNCSHIPQEEEAVVQDAYAAEDEFRVPLHQTFPDGCCCSSLIPNTATFAAKYTSTPPRGDRREREPALRDTPDTTTLPSLSMRNEARAT